MTTLSAATIKPLIKGKEYIIIDELLAHLNFTCSVENKNQLSRTLRELNWEPTGTTKFLGKESIAWVRKNEGNIQETHIRKLELLLDRQNKDLQVIDEMLSKGFSHSDCLTYLKMLYGVQLEILVEVDQEEQECLLWANNLVEHMNLPGKKKHLGLIFQSMGFIYYTQKFFPELQDSLQFNQKQTFLRSSLGISGLESTELEWKILSFEPNFLDLFNKIKHNEYRPFKKYWLKLFLTEQTINKFNLYSFDSKIMAGLCFCARRENKDNPVTSILGLNEKMSEKIITYVKQIKRR